MSEKHPGPLVVEGKLTDAERMKLESNYLRGTIAEDLNDGLTGGFKGDNFLLIRFHGMYQQDDRDIRAERAAQKLEPRHAMLLRCRLPQKQSLQDPLQQLFRLFSLPLKDLFL